MKNNIFYLILLISLNTFSKNIEITYGAYENFYHTLTYGGNNDLTQRGDSHYQNKNFTANYIQEKSYFGFGYSVLGRDFLQLANANAPSGNFFTYIQFYYITYGLKTNSDKSVVGKLNFNFGYQEYKFEDVATFNKYTAVSYRFDIDARLEYHIFIIRNFNFFPFLGAGLTFRTADDFIFQNVSYNSAFVDNPRFDVILLGGIGFGF